MPRKQQTMEPGDVFAVPLGEARYGVGQFIEATSEALNSVACAFFPKLLDEQSLGTGDAQSFLQSGPISVLLVTPDLIKSGRWRKIGHASIAASKEQRLYEQFRSKEWIGAKITGSGIVEKFLSAFHGYTLWEQMKDPNYFDKLLLPGIDRANKE